MKDKNELSNVINDEDRKKLDELITSIFASHHDVLSQHDVNNFINDVNLLMHEKLEKIDEDKYDDVCMKYQDEHMALFNELDVIFCDVRVTIVRATNTHYAFAIKISNENKNLITFYLATHYSKKKIKLCETCILFDLFQ